MIRFQPLFSLLIAAALVFAVPATAAGARKDKDMAELNSFDYMKENAD